jgi:hypothetical protein
MFPPEVHGFLLSLLERFELSFPVGAHIDKLGDHALTWLRPSAGGPSAPTSLSSFATEEELYLIPSLLPEARPALVPYVWPPNHGTPAPPHSSTIRRRNNNSNVCCSCGRNDLRAVLSVRVHSQGTRAAADASDLEVEGH